MSSKNNIWFTVSGCLTREAIDKFLKGTLPTEAKPVVETHVKECELCKVAVEGFKNNPLRDSAMFTSLNNDISTRIQFKMKQKERKRKTNVSLVISIAASLILFIGVFFALELKQVPGGGYLAMNQNSVVIPIDSIQVIPIKIPLNKPISELSFVKPQPLNNTYIATRQVRRQEVETEKNSSKKAVAALKDSVHENVAEETAKTSKAGITYIAMYDTEEEVLEDAVLAEEPKPTMQVQPASTASISQVETKEQSRFVRGKDLYKEHFDADNQFASYEVITEVDEQPRFEQPGYKSFSDYLKQSFKAVYGDQKMMNKEVKYRFVINKEGGVESPEIIKGGTSELNDQVLKILTASPRWQPGVNDSMDVPVIVKLKIEFE